MNDIANSTSAAAIVAATASPSPAAPAAPAAPVTPTPSAAAVPAAADGPAVATANNPAEPAPAESSAPLADARPAYERPPLLIDGDGDAAPEPQSPAKDAPAEPAQPETAPAEKEIAPAEAAPIVYEFAYPEGFSPENLDQERFNEFTSTLQAVKAPPEQAQKFLDMHLREMQRAQIKALDDVWQPYLRQQAEWIKEIKFHPNLGGDNLSQTRANANAFIEQYGGSPENQARLRKELYETGMGNSPALVEAMNNAGFALAREGRPVVVPPPRQTPPSRQQRGLNRYAASNTPGSS